MSEIPLEEIEYVATLILEGVARNQIKNRLKQQYPQQSWSNNRVQRRVQRAEDLLSAYYGSTEVETKRNETLGRLEYLYQKLVEDGDYKGALQVLKEQKAVLGLDAPRKTEVGMTGLINYLDAVVIEETESKPLPAAPPLLLGDKLQDPETYAVEVEIGKVVDSE